jgi:FSR family fosmidomycin resistance protein-like MFS transporter
MSENVMATPQAAVISAPVKRAVGGTVFGVLAAISFSHLLNDMMQSVVPAIYPMLKQSYHLDFGQIGVISLAFQITASLFQPLVGMYTDRRPLPFSLPIGMASTMLGLILLSVASSYGALLAAAALVGLGSSVFHPESARVARMASGGRLGLAQSLFQVGGNSGQALGPLLAAFIVVPRGQGAIAWFCLAAMVGIFVLFRVGVWYSANLKPRPTGRAKRAEPASTLSPRQVTLAIAVLIGLIFSKFFYMASLGNYYTFYLIDQFHVSVQTSQYLLFLFLTSVAVGVVAGGPIGDRFGRKFVIWYSILGVLPFTLILPHANLFWTALLTVPIGLILASGFSGILVYAQELMPGNVGTVSGLFFGFAFGMGGIAAAGLGELADHTSIQFVYEVCAYLPMLGLLTVFLPNVDRNGVRA